MKVGDLVHMPGSCYRDKSGTPATGIVLRTDCDEKIKGFTPIGGVKRPTIKRVEVYWNEDAESSWEPVKWLEVISAGR